MKEKIPIEDVKLRNLYFECSRRLDVTGSTCRHITATQRKTSGPLATCSHQRFKVSDAGWLLGNGMLSPHVSFKWQVSFYELLAHYFSYQSNHLSSNNSSNNGVKKLWFSSPGEKKIIHFIKSICDRTCKSVLPSVLTRIVCIGIITARVYMWIWMLNVSQRLTSYRVSPQVTLLGNTGTLME